MAIGRSLLLLAALAIAAPATAVPVTFTGELNMDGRPLGTSAADAMASGLVIEPISITELDLLGIHGLTVETDLTLNFGTNPVPEPLTAVSDWTLTNGGPIAGSVTLVVASFSPTEVEIGGVSTAIDYVFSEAGLDVEGPEWSFLEVDRTPVDAAALPIYLFAIDLGLVGEGESVEFGMPYYLVDPESFMDGNSNNVVLPTLEVLTVFTPIPEPETGVLLGLGLAGLVSAGKRRE